MLFWPPPPLLLPNPYAPAAVSVESTGALPARTLFSEAVKLLAAKCKAVLTELGTTLAAPGGLQAAAAAAAAAGAGVSAAAL